MCSAIFFFFVLLLFFFPQRPLSPQTSAPYGDACWDTGCLELIAGRWFRGGHDLHVLGEDSLESLVSVDHGTEHQWLKEAETPGHHLQSTSLPAAPSHTPTALTSGVHTVPSV